MNMYNPYIMQMPQTQDLGGLAPYMQNIANQQANQNMAMQQAQGLTQQAGQTAQGGMNPMALAMMLRKGQSAGPAKYVGPSYGTNPAFNNSHFNTMSYD
jgi:hypothetical protein